jgi:nucleoside recognition membrane protein YjiH
MNEGRQIMDSNIKQETNVTWVSYLVLFIVLIVFSGIFAKSTGVFKAVDFGQLVGDFGKIPFEKGYNFRGTGGSGAKDGFLMALQLTPPVILALGIVSICEGYGGLMAAHRLLSPLFRPFLGIPGICGLAFIASLQSTDTGGGMTKELFDSGFISDQERTIFCQLQLSGDATITNYFGSGAALFPFLILPLGLPLLVIFFFKVLGANIMRFIISFDLKKQVTN